MPEKPSKKKYSGEETEKSAAEKTETNGESSWSSDQKKRSYYYDDACGYEIYQPDEDEDEEN